MNERTARLKTDYLGYLRRVAKTYPKNPYIPRHIEFIQSEFAVKITGESSSVSRQGARKIHLSCGHVSWRGRTRSGWTWCRDCQGQARRAPMLRRFCMGLYMRGLL